MAITYFEELKADERVPFGCEPVTRRRYRQNGEPVEVRGYLLRKAVGAVVADREQNLYHDSYFHAIYWDGFGFHSEEYGATAYCRDSGCQVDAPQALIDAYHAEQDMIWEEIEINRREREMAEAKARRDELRDAEETFPEGTSVTVLTNRARKAKKGETGTVVKVMRSFYDDERIVVAVDFPGKRVYLSQSNLSPW